MLVLWRATLRVQSKAMNWSDELDAHDASFDDDALAVDATGYVATLLGALCMFVLIGLGWFWLCFGW